MIIWLHDVNNPVVSYKLEYFGVTWDCWFSYWKSSGTAPVFLGPWLFIFKVFVINVREKYSISRLGLHTLSALKPLSLKYS